MRSNKVCIFRVPVLASNAPGGRNQNDFSTQVGTSAGTVSTTVQGDVERIWRGGETMCSFHLVGLCQEKKLLPVMYSLSQVNH